MFKETTASRKIFMSKTGEKTVTKLSDHTLKESLKEIYGENKNDARVFVNVLV